MVFNNGEFLNSADAAVELDAEQKKFVGSGFLSLTRYQQIFLSAADQTIIVSSYGRIGSDLHGLEKVSWLATA